MGFHNQKISTGSHAFSVILNEKNTSEIFIVLIYEGRLYSQEQMANWRSNLRYRDLFECKLLSRSGKLSLSSRTARSKE